MMVMMILIFYCLTFRLAFGGVFRGGPGGGPGGARGGPGGVVEPGGGCPLRGRLPSQELGGQKGCGIGHCWEACVPLSGIAFFSILLGQ